MQSIKAWVLIIPVMIGMAVEILGIVSTPDVYMNSVYLILSSIVVIYVGRDTHMSAFRGLKNNKQFNMDALISIGTMAAVSTGVMVFFYPIENYAGVGGYDNGFTLSRTVCVL